MLIHYHYYKILLIFNLSLSAIRFDTELGKCHLESSLNNTEIIQHIKNTATALIKEFGGIDKKGIFYVKIINNNSLWKEQFPNLDWASGVAIKNKIFINNKISNKKKLLQTISHEICHLYQYKIKNGTTFPSWFKEGMAMHFSKELLINKINNIAKSVWLNCLIPLNDLKNISQLDKNKINLAYEESLLAYQLIIKEFGKESIDKIIKSMNTENISFDLAFNNNININLSQFESQFDFKLANSKEKYIIFRQPMSWFFLSTIGVIIIYIIIRFKNRKIIQKWKIEEELEKLNEDFIDNTNN